MESRENELTGLEVCGLRSKTVLWATGGMKRSFVLIYAKEVCADHDPVNCCRCREKFAIVVSYCAISDAEASISKGSVTVT